MQTRSRLLPAALAALAAACAACASAAGRTPEEPAPSAARTPAEQARMDGGRPRYTPADLRFMQGMIAHHAQAVVMARWAATHGARPDVRTLAGRIEVAQGDEIALLMRWLRARGESAPDTAAGHVLMGHHGAHGPGMLSPEELARLDRARGPEFDRLFLAFMIRHHEGAVAMVRELFASPGAGQEPNVFRFASDVEVDQTTEIERMRSMLAALPSP